MSPDAPMLILFVVVMIVAAHIFLATERRPPIPPDGDPTKGFRDPSRGDDGRNNPDADR